jgi:hypothetical protein
MALMAPPHWGRFQQLGVRTSTPVSLNLKVAEAETRAWKRQGSYEMTTWKKILAQHLSKLARAWKTNIYALKKSMLSEFIKKVLRSPTTRMAPI